HLERMTQFKDKARQHRENINAGLFSYPILQAADILLYKAEVVPVGEDQVQHIELARELTRKFNARYGNLFPEPQELLSTAPRIMGLDGKTKMSKSLNNYISLTEPPEDIWKKLSVAVTDENRKKRSDPGDPDKCNVYSLHKHFSSPEEVDWSAQGCRTAGIGCLECKKCLSDNIVRELRPIRERALALFEDPAYVVEVLKSGAERCQEMARKTMQEVKDAIGLRVSAKRR
ncbi:MAG TPA: tryptophan--tRNA ligase, partial [Candidatus Brocadiales bacterium]|nr:tryptophan--tRNA ligase [Candidatus Brocadiales bacterium]